MEPRTRAGKVVYWRKPIGASCLAAIASALLVQCDQQSDEPVLERLSEVTDLVSGPSHTCALLESGRVACWGLNDLGQLATQPATGAFEVLDPLGIATTEEAFYSARAALVEGVQGVARLAAGESHTCALLDDESVRCWGNAGGGQLGAGDFSEDECEGRPCSRQPVKVVGLQSVVELSLGALHSCALDGAGELRCWGSRALGVETEGLPTCDGTPCATEPLLVQTPAPVVQVAGGFAHTCVLLKGGEVRCWGVNVLGSVGIASPWTETAGGIRVHEDVQLPARVELPAAAAELFAAPGGFNTCALLEDGSLHCWGDNSYGQLGNGETSEPCAGTGASAFRCSAVPVEVDLDLPVKRAALGERHACAVTADDSLYCWGYAGSGQLAAPIDWLQQCPNFALCSADPLPVAVESPPLLKIALGARFTCVLQADGRVLCWGWGDPANPIDNPNAQRMDCVFSEKFCEVKRDWEGSATGIFVTQYETLCVITSAGEVYCLSRFESGPNRYILSDAMLVER